MPTSEIIEIVEAVGLVLETIIIAVLGFIVKKK